MELRHLRYFVAVAEELNFRRAADRLHLAQPSLGRQIRDLEEEIGEPLFERSRSRVALTEAGRALLGEARGVLDGASSALNFAREAGRGVTGTLRIGNIGVLSASFLPGTLARYRKLFPNVQIDVLELMNAEQRTALLAGTIQIGFQIRIPDELPDSPLAARLVSSFAALISMSSSHPLAAGSSVSLESLADVTLLHLRPTSGSAYEKWVRKVCGSAGFNPRFRKPPIDNANALFAHVAAGDGLAFVPETLTRTRPPSDDWVARPLRPELRVVVDAVWNEANPSRILSNFLSILPSE